MRPSIFFTVFARRKAHLSVLEWLKLLLLEAYLGEQLLEMLANTSSYQTNVKAQVVSGSVASGWKVPLSEYIPSTLTNRLIASHIEHLLRKKFLETYELIREASTEAVLVYLKSDLFELNPHKLHLLTELKLAYNTIWICVNLTIDVVVFVITKDLVAVLFAGGMVEVIRRLKI